jgi:hypothetical protein
MATITFNGRTFAYDRDNLQPVTRARKLYQCTHDAGHSHPIDAPCAGDIKQGDPYVRVRQSWLEWDPVNLGCAIAAGVLTERESADPVEEPDELEPDGYVLASSNKTRVTVAHLLNRKARFAGFNFGRALCNRRVWDRYDVDERRRDAGLPEVDWAALLVCETCRKSHFAKHCKE